MGFLDGAKSVVSGARRLLRDSGLRRWAVAPVFITLVLYALGLATAAATVDDVLARFWAPPEGAVKILWVAVAALLFVALAAVLVLTFVAIATAISGPFHERIAGVLLDEHNVAKNDVGFVRGLVIDIAWAITFAIPAGGLALGALLFAPLAVPSLAVASIGLAVSAAGPALNATGHGFGARFVLLRQRFGLLAGAGAVLALALLVPALGLFAIPAAVIGLTERLAVAGALTVEAR